MITHKYCTKDNPMPLQEGPVAAEKGVIWHHDQIVCLDLDDLCERWVPYECKSCGYQWVADLGD